MRNIYDLKRDIQDLQNVKDVIATLERISAIHISPLKRQSDVLQEYVMNAQGIIKKLRIKEKKTYFETSKKLLIIFSTNHGLVGGLNIRLFEKIVDYIRENHDLVLAVFGQKGVECLRSYKIIPEIVYPALSDKPKFEELNHFFEQIFSGVINWSQISVGAPNFISVLEYKSNISKIYSAEDIEEEVKINNEKYEENLEQYSFTEPSKRRILEFLQQRLVKLAIYEQGLNAKLCEHSARMMAMSDAGKSSGKIINGLERQYFKSRQQTITKRLSEVFSAKQSLKQ